MKLPIYLVDLREKQFRFNSILRYRFWYWFKPSLGRRSEEVCTRFICLAKNEKKKYKK